MTKSHEQLLTDAVLDNTELRKKLASYEDSFWDIFEDRKRWKTLAQWYSSVLRGLARGVGIGIIGLILLALFG